MNFEVIHFQKIPKENFVLANCTEISGNFYRISKLILESFRRNGNFKKEINTHKESLKMILRKFLEYS